MPMEILKPYSAWGGQSVLHIMWGVCHPVPSPEHSQKDRSGKAKRNGDVHMGMAGRSPPGGIWVGWDGGRAGGHCSADCRCLAAEVCVAVVSWPMSPVQGHPTGWTELCPSQNKEWPCWARLPAPRKSLARAGLGLPGRS